MNLLMTDSKFLYAIDLNARIQAAKSTGRTYFAKLHVFILEIVYSRNSVQM